MSEFKRIFVALMVIGLMQGLVLSVAMACSALPTHSTTIVADDTPECLEIQGVMGMTGVVQVYNRCEEAAVFEAVECEACQGSATAFPVDPVNEEPKRIYIEQRDEEELVDGEITYKRYTWQMGEASGEIEMEVLHQYQDTSGCPEGPVCSLVGTEGESQSNLWLVLLGLCAFGLRKRPSVAG